MKDLQNKQKDKASEWLTIMKKNQGKLEQIAPGNQHSRILMPEFEEVASPLSHEQLYIKIDIEDVQEKIAYWESSIICYVIGANPPFPVMDGFVRRIWRKKGIDKVVFVRNVVFLVKFHDLDQRDEILLDGFHFFDKKSVIVKNGTLI